MFYFLAKDTYRSYILLAASLLFYAYGEPRFVFVMIASIVINYVLAGLIALRKAENRKSFARNLLILAVIVNVGILFVFKYLDLAITSCNMIFNTDLPIREIALPIGISFFTFQSLSYVIDVYRGTVRVQKNPFTLHSIFPSSRSLSPDQS